MDANPDSQLIGCVNSSKLLNLSKSDFFLQNAKIPFSIKKNNNKGKTAFSSGVLKFQNDNVYKVLYT